MPILKPAVPQEPVPAPAPRASDPAQTSFVAPAMPASPANVHEPVQRAPLVTAPAQGEEPADGTDALSAPSKESSAD